MEGLAVRRPGRDIDLLERERELAALEEWIDAACDGAGSAALIEGPAGIGKTRLLEVTASRAAERMQVLVARASELDRDTPFQVVRRLLEPALDALTPAPRAFLLSGAAEPARVLLEGGDGVAASGTGATLRALYWLCARLSEERPLMLAVDDAHWADRTSLRWLSYLAGMLDGLPLLLVCTLRPAEPGGESSELHALAGGMSVRRVAPGALSQDAVAAIVRTQLEGDADEALCTACHEATGGNPFLLRELMAALASEGPGDAEQVRALASSGVSASVLARLARLRPEAGALTRAVAVLGDGTDLATAALLAGVPEDAARDAAGALVRCEILAPGAAVGFVHPLVRASVYETLAPAERGRMHARAARLLADRDASPSGLAVHLLAAEPAGDPWVVSALARAAARASARGAAEEAVTYLRRALEEPPAGDERSAVLLALGTAEAVSLDPRAEERLEAALASGGSPAVRGLAALELGRARLARERYGDAVAAFQRGIPALGAGDRELALRLEAESLTAENESASRGRSTAARATRLLAEADAAATPAERLLLGAIAWAEALAVAEDADVVADHAARALAGGHMLATETAESPTFYTAVTALTVSDRLTEAIGHLDDALADARRRNSVRAFAMASSCRSWASYRGGALDDAEADARAVLTMAEEHGWLAGVPIAFSVLADCLLLRDRVDEAAAVVASWWDESRMTSTTMLGTALMVRGRVRLLTGDPAGALEDFQLCARRHADWCIRNPAVGTAGAACARMLAAGGHQDEAQRLVADELELARAYGAPRTLGMVLRDAGIVGESTELIEEAVSVLAASEARLEHARALMSLGRALAQDGKPSDARQPLREALDVAHRCGAAALAERARRDLVAAGGRPRRLVLSGVEALTPSELRIARLAASGLTNREIAEQQFLTSRMVEAHLSSSYRKLEIRSRDELVKALGGR